MREGMRRLVMAIRWLSVLWLIGWALYIAFVPERVSDLLGDLLIELAFVLGPGFGGIAVAWILEGFVQKSGPK